MLENTQTTAMPTVIYSEVEMANIEVLEDITASDDFTASVGFQIGLMVAILCGGL